MNSTLVLQPRAYRIAVSTFFFVSGLLFSTWASRIPDIKNSLQLSEAGLGAVLFALPVGQIAGLPVSAWLSRKLGVRTLLLVASLLCPVALVMLALVTTSFQLIAALLVFGIWGNMINIAMNTQAVGVEAIYGRSIMASFHGLWSVAAFAGAVLGSFFVNAGSSPMIHFSFVCGIIGMLVLLAFRNTLPEERSAEERKPGFSMPDKRILQLGIIAFCCMICEGAMADWSGVYFQKVVEVPVRFITLGYVAFTATMAMGRFIGDWLVTKLDVKRVLQLSGGVATAGLATVILLPNVMSATTGFLLIGFGVSSVVPLVYGLAGKTKSMSTTGALAAVSTIGFLGFLVGPPLIGFIAQAAGLQFSFAILAVLALSIIFLASYAGNHINT